MNTHTTHPQLSTDGLKTTVVLVGAGGTGSHFLESLARMHIAMLQLDHNGLHVTVIDDDTVEPHNVGRQLFGWGDVKANKAHAIVARVNRVYGTTWKALSERTPLVKLPANIMVTAVDNNRTRHEMQNVMQFLQRTRRNGVVSQQEHDAMLRLHYWLDMGNDDTYGQVVLGGHGLATSIDALGMDHFPDVPVTDSCSMEQSLQRQDLFINQQVATVGVNMLWNLFRRGHLKHNMTFMNLTKGTMRSELKLHP